MPRLSKSAIFPLIRSALREDRASRDITSRAVLPSTSRVRAQIVAKAAGVLAGGPIARWVFQARDPSLRCTLIRSDGSTLAPGQVLLTVEGRARSIFAAERTVLNLLGHLSGIATLTQAYVRRVKPYRATILDTRKTLPGLRLIEKYAVVVGGGQNHRLHLSDAVLIKTNHLEALRQTEPHIPEVVQEAIVRATMRYPKKVIAIEVRNLQELDEALSTGSEIILLDNWPIQSLAEAVKRRNAYGKRPLVEVSGGVTLANVRAIAKTGVDRISIGRLTHSVPNLDMSLTVSSNVR